MGSTPKKGVIDQTLIREFNNQKILLFGRWTSYIGNIVFDYANNNIIANTLNLKPAILALYQSSETIIALLFNLFGGAVADRWNKKKILIITDLISATLCMILGFFAVSKYFIVAIILVNALLAVVSAFNKPSYKSIIKGSISDVGSQIIEIIGPTVGMIVVFYLSDKGAMFVNAVTFLFSGIVELGLVISETPKYMKHKSIISDIIAGIRYTKKNKVIFIVIVIASAANFFFAGYNLVVPYLNTIIQDQLPNAYATILTTEAIGGIVGSFSVSKVDNDKSISGNKLLFILGLTGMVLISIPFFAKIPVRYIILIPFFGFSAFLSVFNIEVMSFIQLKVEEEYMGRVFSIISTFSVLFMPFGAITFSFINMSINSFLCIGIGILVLSIIGVVMIKKIK